MKTKTLTIVAIIALALGTVNLTKAAAKNDAAGIVLNSISKINKIEVHGNVEVYVSDGSADQVKVYNHYYAENALVQSQNGVLRISSYTAEKLVVWVTVNDLHAISAYDNAEVRSFGKLSEIDLNVNLYDNATAKLNLDSYSTDINVKDHAKAELTGTASECDLNYDQDATVSHTNFAATHFHKVMKNTKPTFASAEDELANL